MKIIDLSQAHKNGMTQFPGTPPVDIQQICNIAEHGFNVTDFHAIVHTGTHCDAYEHYVDGAKTIDSISLDHFIGDAIIVDITTEHGREVSADILSGITGAKGKILLLRSGFSKYWGTDKYTQDYPYLSLKLAKKIVEMGFVSVGLDFLSPDPVDGDAVHKVLLGAGVPIIENLNHLDLIQSPNFIFCAAPLLIQGAEGAFTRAFALLNNE